MAIIPAAVVTRSLWGSVVILGGIVLIVVYGQIAFFRAPLIATNVVSATEVHRAGRMGTLIVMLVVGVVIVAIMVRRAV